jgi:tRNA (guanosine-2'-O-)-methyltransferase
MSFTLRNGLEIDPLKVIELVGPLLTEERRRKIEQVISGRTKSIAVMTESLYDRGNISAVMRSAEAFGFFQFHLIENQEKFKESQRTTAGADKWLEVKKWKKTEEAVSHWRSRGYRIVATHLAKSSRPLEEIDFSQPTVLVLGNEKDGISEVMQREADELALIPMYGYVQSFNISVAAAISLYHIHEARRRLNLAQGDLAPQEKNLMRAQHYLLTQASGWDLLERHFGEQK